MNNAVKNNKKRPISPHLTIYRPQITSMLSIFHRITGALLFLSLLVVSWWFILFIFSDFKQQYIDICSFKVFKLLLFLISFCFFYHLSTGIRHLIWDTASLMSLKFVYITGYCTILSSFTMTAIFWHFIA